MTDPPETQPPGLPPLLITTDRRLAPDQLRCLRDSFDRAWQGPAKVVVLEEGMKLFQFVDGKFVPVDPPPERPGVRWRSWTRWLADRLEAVGVLNLSRVQRPSKNKV